MWSRSSGQGGFRRLGRAALLVTGRFAGAPRTFLMVVLNVCCTAPIMGAIVTLPLVGAGDFAHAYLTTLPITMPTPDHFLPLAYLLGDADGDDARVLNDICNLGSMAMTGFVFSSERPA